MHFSLEIFILTTLISFTNYQHAQAQSDKDLLETLQRKVHRLERTGQIKRDYQPYTEPPLKDEGNSQLIS